MGKTKDLGHLAHIVAYDSGNHITVPAGITMHTNQLVASQPWVTTALGSYALSSSLSSYVPTSRTITINGTAYDLSANREWNITSMIYPAAGIALSTGSAWGSSITNNSANWNTAYGWGNHASAGYLTGITSTQVTTALGFTPYNSSNPAGYITGISFANVSAKPTTLSGYGITDAASSTHNHNGTYVPVGRTITINGTAYDLSADRSWTVSASSTQLLSPNGATVVAADSAMPNAGHSFIHTLALGPGGNDGHILAMTWASTTTAYGAQLWIDTDPTNTMAFRSRSNAGAWTGWNTVIHSSNIGSQSVNYAASSGNADTVDGYHGSNYLGKNGNSYYQQDTWIQLNGNHGLYAPSYNDAHFFPNTNSYGSWKILGSRNGWRGLHFGEGSGMTLMMNETEFGFHREGIGWYARFTNGTGHFNISGSAASANSATNTIYINTQFQGSGSVNTSEGRCMSLRTDSGAGAAVNYAPVLHMAASDTMWQMQGTYGTSGNGTLYFRQGYAGSWGNWLTMISSANIGSQSVSYANSAGSISGQANSATINATSGNAGNQIVLRDGNGDIAIGTLNTNHAFFGGGGRGLTAADTYGSYGNIMTYGTGQNGWYGYGIRDNSGYRSFFMSNSGNYGIYAQDWGKWAFYFSGSTQSYSIGSDSPVAGYTLYLIYGLYTVGLYNASDARMKKDIKPLTSSLDKVKALRGVSYEYIDKGDDGTKNKGLELGFIAQEVLPVIPELIRYDEKKGYAMNYNGVSAVLVEAVKEQQIQIENQQNQINNLTLQLTELLNK
jgi:hypothetical protein